MLTAALTNPVGGGTDNIAFLQGAGAPNANAFSVTSTFWLETVSQSSGIFTQLQYSQTVFLNFNGLTWPHVSVATLRLVPVVPCRFASADFVGVYLRLDGSNVSPSSPLGGTVNGQFGAMTWERFSIEPQSDGSSAIASIQFPGVYLALNGTGVNPSHPTGGSVQAAWGVGANSRFFLRDQPDGSIFVESAQFPGVFLFLKAPGVTQSNGPGVGTAGCQAGTASIGNGIRFYFSN